jgi:tetratricopeptide (TPR) repeat protein
MIARWFVKGALAILVLTCRGAAQTVPELLEKGIYTQETAGDVDRAIEIYRQIVSSAPAVRSYAAQAQYRLAQCLLQKRAGADAAREFRKVIEGYPEDKDLVARARESILPLARYLEADYYDPVLGLSFTSPEWPVSQVMRLDGGSVQISLSALYAPPRYPQRVDMPVVLARTRKAPSVQAWFEEYQQQCRTCRVVSTGELGGRQVLAFASDRYRSILNPGVPTVSYGVLLKSGKTEVMIRAEVPADELERNQAIIERIAESVRTESVRTP